MIRRIVVAVACGCTCTAGPAQAQFQNGEFITYSQEHWGTAPSAASLLLTTQFSSRYPTGLVVGAQSGFLMAFTSAPAVLNFLPQSGAAGPLNSDLLNPSSSPSGVFGGFVVALQLDVDFNDSAHLTGTSAVLFGDLVLHDLTGASAFNGMTVREFLAEVNLFLGAASVPPVSYGDAAILTMELTEAFESGTPSSFAQAHLRLPCYPDCNADGALTVADFGCFQTAFVAGNPYADCNQDGTLSVSDFGCFQTAFVAGCP